MDPIAYLSEHHDHLFYLIAGLSFILELTVMGMGGPLLFFAIASFVTALLISGGLISGWEVEIFTLGVLTGFIALFLWKPMKKFQNTGDGTDTSSDMIGREVNVSNEVTRRGGTIRYSGINWNSRLVDDCDSESIAAGEACIIVSVDGNVMLVKPL